MTTTESATEHSNTGLDRPSWLRPQKEEIANFVPNYFGYSFKKKEETKKENKTRSARRLSSGKVPAHWQQSEIGSIFEF